MNTYKNTFFFGLCCSLLLASCTTTPPSDPLEDLCEKFAVSASVSFTMNQVWHNTFVQDTTRDVHQASYLRSDNEVFPFDFVYTMEDFTTSMIKGEMRDINFTKEKVITYTEEEALEDLAYEGGYAAMGSPMIRANDSLWQRVGSSGPEAVYEYIDTFAMDDEPDRILLNRLRIDTVTLELTAIETFLTQGGEPVQDILKHYTGWRWNDIDKLEFPASDFPTIAKADEDKQEQTAKLEPGMLFPDLLAKDLNGEPISMASLRDKKTVFVFSFIGCGGCEHTRRELEKNNFTFAEGYQGVYLNPRDDAEQIDFYHADKPWPLQMATIDYAFAERCGVFVYPTFVTVDEEGFVEEVMEGYEEAYFANKGVEN